MSEETENRGENVPGYFTVKVESTTEVHVSRVVKLPTEYVGTWAEAGGKGTVGVVIRTDLAQQ